MTSAIVDAGHSRKFIGSREGRVVPGIVLAAATGWSRPLGGVSSWARERTGRLALRGSAMAIEMVLDIAPGNQTAISEKAAEGST